MGRIIQTASNIAILVFVGLVAWREFFTIKSNGRLFPPSVVGKNFVLPSTDQSKSNLRVAMILSTNCRYCLLYAPFLQKLESNIELLSNRRVSIFAIFKESLPAAEAFAKESLKLKSKILSVHKLPDNLSIPTPAILLINGEDIVTGAWIGMPSRENEASQMKDIMDSISK